DDRDGHKAARQFQRRRDGLFEPRGDSLLHEQAVNHNFDSVIFAFINDRKFIELVKLAIDARANVAILREFFKFLAVRAFSSAHDGREDHDAVVRFANFSVQNGLHDLFAGLARDGFSAVGAMRYTDGGVDHAKIIINFSNGADGRARRARGSFLLDGDRRRKSFDHVHFGAFHLIEKLPRVSGERLDVAALTFGVYRVK